MPQAVHHRKYGVATTIPITLYEIDGVDFKVDATPDVSDCRITKDEGAEIDCVNAFIDEGTGYSLLMQDSEMQAARIVVYIADDTGTKAYLDTSIVIETGPLMSDVLIVKSDAATAASDTSLLLPIIATSATAASDTTLLLVVTTKIVSDILVNKSELVVTTTKLASDTTVNKSELTLLVTATTKLQSDMLLIQSDAATAASDTTLLLPAIATSATAASDTTLLLVNAVNIQSDVVVAQSGLTILRAADITTMASDLLLIKSDVATVISDLIMTRSDVVVAQSGLTILRAADIATVASDLLLVKSDVATVITATTKLQSDILLIQSDVNTAKVSAATAASDTTLLIVDSAKIKSDMLLIQSDAAGKAIVEGTLTLHDEISTILASVSQRSSGGGLIFRNVANDTNRLTIVADGSGNRTNSTIDVSDI